MSPGNYLDKDFETKLTNVCIKSSVCGKIGMSLTPGSILDTELSILSTSERYFHTFHIKHYKYLSYAPIFNYLKIISNLSKLVVMLIAILQNPML